MSRGYSTGQFVLEVARYEYHPEKVRVLADSCTITFDGNFQVWHNGGIVYESYDRDAAIAYVDKCLEQWR